MVKEVYRGWSHHSTSQNNARIIFDIAFTTEAQRANLAVAGNRARLIELIDKLDFFLS